MRNGTLLVGYSENRPWVTKSGDEPGGTEAELVKQFAQTLNAKIEWHNDTEQNLFERLEKNEIHLVIAGLTDETPWKKTIGITRPAVAPRPGLNPIQSSGCRPSPYAPKTCWKAFSRSAINTSGSSRPT